MIEGEHDQCREPDGGDEGERDEAVEEHQVGALGRRFFWIERIGFGLTHI